MKLCKTCFSSPWPFLLMTVIALIAGFVTWLSVGLSQPQIEVQVGVSVLAFLAVEATLVHYVISCMRRHCRHHAPRVQRSTQFDASS